MTITIHHGNALNLPLPNASVDLVVTSPPYFGLRSYQDGGTHYDGQLGAEATPAAFVDALITATAEMIRVLKPTGSIWVNLGDKYLPGKSLAGVPWRYANQAVDDLGLILRAEVIWSKPNGMPDSAQDRVRRSHETWFHLVKQPQYYSSLDNIRGPVGISKSRGKGIGDPSRNGYDNGKEFFPANPVGRAPGSVWEIATTPLIIPEHLGVDHYAAFPMEWPRRIITGWCPPGGTVLDPFGGTGTTALVAHALGRHGITNDLSHDYCRIAQWRTTDPAQLAAAMQVDKPAPAPEGMDSLLDLL